MYLLIPMDIIKVIFWGRGGQGVKTCAEVLARAAFNQGLEVQAFPEYGPERSGAPVRSFLKISSKPIKEQCQITDADFVVILDSSLLQLAFFVHDFAEGISLKGDVDFINKDSAVEREEEEALELLFSVLHPALANEIRKATLMVETVPPIWRRGETPEKVGLTAQFFNAVENAGYVSRALYEVRAGNLPFVNVFYDQWEKVEYYIKKFESFRSLIEPHLEFMEDSREKYKDAPWRHQK